MIGELSEKTIDKNLSSFFETFDDILLVGDLNGTIKYINQAAVKKLKYSYEELYSMNLLDLHPEDKKEEAINIFRDMIMRKRDTCLLAIETKTGQLLYVETKVWFGKWNGEECMFAIIKDLSASEAALDKFHKLFDNNPALMAIRNLDDQKFKEVNDAFCEKLGYTKEEIIGKSAKELGLYVEPEKQIEISEMISNNKKIKNIEIRVRSKTGQIMTGLFSGEVIDNQIEKSFLTVMADITELKNNEKKLKMKDKILSAVAKSTGILLDSVDYMDAISKCFKLLGEATDVNRVYLFENSYKENERYTSQKIEWNADTSAPQIDNPELQDLSFEDIKSFIEPLENGKAYYGKISDFDDDVRAILEAQEILSLVVMPVMVNNTFWGFVGFDECKYERDWSEVEYSILMSFNASLERAIEKQLMESALQESRKKAEAANIAKSQFLANMSHEIRTPINGVMGMLSLLDYTNLTQEQASYIKEAKNASEILLYLINDILDISKIEAGKMTLEKMSFDLRAMLEDTVSVFMPKASEKRLDLNLFIKANVPNFVVGDPAKLRQVINNLLSNAFKFTKQGEINIDVDIEDVIFKEKVKLKFTITDTGIGMNSEVKNRIFTPFIQGDDSTTRKYGGTGLGLAISSELVHLMEGEFRVESEENEGSTFEFTATFEETMDENLSGNKYKCMENTNILVVDDNDTNRNIVRCYLEEFGVNVFEASGGEKAIALLLTKQAIGEKMDLVISDYKMPNMSGMELVSTIRSIPSLKDIKFILLTSVTQKGDAHKAKSEGFHAYLTKPIKKNDLIATTSLVLGIVDKNLENTPIITSHLEKEIKRSYQPKILMVEDNLINQKVVVKTLQKKGYQCDLAANGEEAIKAVLEHGYDIIFMDCQMPVMDGYQATRRIRELEKSEKRIKIVAMTAYAMEGDKEKCIEAGMDDYLTKPMDFDEVIRHIENIKIDEKSNLDADIWTPFKNVFMDKSGLDEEETANIFNEFEKIFENQIELLEKASQNRDFESIQNIAHQIKGSAANLRIETIKELAEHLEINAINKDIDICEKIIRKL